MPGSPTDRVIQVQRDPSGSWEYALAGAARSLPAPVGDYCGFREHGAALRRRQVPHDALTLVISFGDALSVAPTSGPGGTFRSFVAGLHDRPVLTRHDGVQHGIEVSLPPATGYRLLGRPLHELTNAVVELADLFGSDADRLVDRLAEAPGWAERFALLDTEFAGRLAATAPVAAEVDWALGVLTRRRGRVPIAQLAAGSGWSQRHFTARFRAQVGLGPKAYARVLRFQHAWRRMRTTPEHSWAQIAVDAGYADQPHLNYDFRQLAGLPPSALLAAALPGGVGTGA